MDYPEPKQVPVTTTIDTSARPVRDEWGLYDPEQAGLEAVIRRMSAAKDEATKGGGTSLAPRSAHSRSW